MEATPDVIRSAGDSSVQQNAEAVMIRQLAEELGTRLDAAVIVLDGRRVEIDAADEERTVLVESWAHQGPPKGGQRNKVLADALKLAWVRARTNTEPRLILLLSDEAAARPFRSERTWFASALADLNVEIRVVAIPAKLRLAIMAAQVQQSR